MQDVNPDTLRTWITALLVLWNAGLSAVVWLRKPGLDASNAVETMRAECHLKHDAINARVAIHNTDISSIKVTLTHMPTKEELANLEGSVRELSARTQGLVASLGAVQAAIGRIESYLLQGVKR